MDFLSAELKGVLNDLGSCIEAFGPYRRHVVLVGGLAVLLYRWCFPESDTNRPALSTFDIDWAIPPRLDCIDGEGLHQKMERSGFIPKLRGDGKEPVTYYQHIRHGNEKLAPIYAEFIAPRIGSKTDRHGINKGIIEVQQHLHAQTDPYLGLLLIENFKLDVSNVTHIGLSKDHSIRLPHPICFIVQKILIRNQRPLHKRANDAAHIYDVALLTQTMWPEMAEVLARVKNSGQFPARWFQRMNETIKRAFLDEDAPAPSEITNIFSNIMGQTTAPTADAVSRVLKQLSLSTGLLSH
jgi:hypothetical protein